MINFDNLDKMITEKYISVQKHPTLDLYIYNYSQRTQFDRVWNNETLQCRGLIMDGNKNVVSRPFRKFFNLGELAVSQSRNLQKKILAGTIDFTATEKVDGSLGMSYFDLDGKMYIATRGSFVSDQAKKDNEILGKIISKKLFQIWDDTYTYLWEIIYPSNRIVINYGDTENLVLLAMIKTKTGEELSYSDMVENYEKYFSIVPRFDGITDFSKIEQKQNEEGYVIHFHSTGLRFKLKFDEYVRLHRIITGINAKRIWELLSTNTPMDDILERVPDEFYAWVQSTKETLELKYKIIEKSAHQAYMASKELPTRKEQAEYILHGGILPNVPPWNTSVVFSMLDGKDYSGAIWKSIEPPFERPFKVDEP